jgi:signal transduction histidine kinase
MNVTLRFPIRLQILVTMLVVVTGVVGAIVFTMVNLFHADKQTYIRDLTSVVTGHAADECRMLLTSYEDRLQTYGRIVGDGKLPAEVKVGALRQFFVDFPELVGIEIREPGKESGMAFNDDLLASFGLDKQAFVEDFEPVAAPFVRNSTLSAELPTMTMVVSLATDQAPAEQSLAAVIRSDSMMHLVTRSEAFEMFLTGSDGRYLAHPSRMHVERRENARSSGLGTAKTAGGVTVGEYAGKGVDYIGGHAAIGFAGVTVETRIPQSAAYLASRELLESLIFVAVGLLLAAIVVGLVGAHRLTRPLRKLSDATGEIARGQFRTRVDVTSGDEIGELAGSFNRMASQLLERDEALDEAQAKLIQSEKMAAFGQLGAGIAHEVKNPLAGILGCAQISLKKVERGTAVEKNLRLIEKETKRCKSIIENLLRFARQEPAMLKPIRVNPVVEDALAIVAHQLGMHKISIEKELAEELPLVHGHANQLQQVLMNLVMNAQQAMGGDPGTVRIRTATTGDGRVAIRIEDDGPGMTEEVRAKLFEPFFTTKPDGKGTGLGLSVSFGILEDHRGEIEVESAPGQGSSFTVLLPILEEQISIASGGRSA